VLLALENGQLVERTKTGVIALFGVDLVLISVEIVGEIPIGVIILRNGNWRSRRHA